MRYIIEQEMSLANALAHLAEESSRTTRLSWLREKRVTVDGEIVTGEGKMLQPGQEVRLVGQKKRHEAGISIVYEDRALVVIEKPEGILSVKSDLEQEHTIHAIIKKRYFPKPVFVVHRLDFATSGLMLFALEKSAYFFLKSELAHHRIQRIYYGVCEGHLEGSGTWSCRLFEDKNYHMHVTSSIRGEQAITHYTVIRKSERYSLVRFELQTGKKNQIRVQAAHAGHPLVGDTKYGASSDPIGRLALHATELHFPHPVHRRTLSFSLDLPRSFLTLVPSTEKAT